MLEELRKLEAAATPGPWNTVRLLGTGEVFGPKYSTLKRGEDAALIAAMRNALPALLDFLRYRELDEAFEQFIEGRRVALYSAQGAEQRPETGIEENV